LIGPQAAGAYGKVSAPLDAETEAEKKLMGGRAGLTMYILSLMGYLYPGDRLGHDILQTTTECIALYSQSLNYTFDLPCILWRLYQRITAY
jgi:hypothetical protein